MADNLLDVVGPPTAKRPKLNSPLSGSDGTGEQQNQQKPRVTGLNGLLAAKMLSWTEDPGSVTFYAD